MREDDSKNTGGKLKGFCGEEEEKPLLCDLVGDEKSHSFFLGNLQNPICKISQENCVTHQFYF